MTEESQGNATGAIVPIRTPREISYREDGTVAGLESDKENDKDLNTNCGVESRGAQGSEHQDVDLERGVHADCWKATQNMCASP